MTYEMNAKFVKGPVSLVFTRYPQGGAPALVLMDLETGDRVATASVNVMDWKEEWQGYILIKDWSENEGVLAELVRHGIVEDTGKRIPTGFVEAALCKLLVTPPAE